MPALRKRRYFGDDQSVSLNQGLRIRDTERFEQIELVRELYRDLLRLELEVDVYRAAGFVVTECLAGVFVDLPSELGKAAPLYRQPGGKLMSAVFDERRLAGFERFDEVQPLDLPPRALADVVVGRFCSLSLERYQYRRQIVTLGQP